MAYFAVCTYSHTDREGPPGGYRSPIEKYLNPQSTVHDRSRWMNSSKPRTNFDLHRDNVSTRIRSSGSVATSERERVQLGIFKNLGTHTDFENTTDSCFTVCAVGIGDSQCPLASFLEEGRGGSLRNFCLISDCVCMRVGR
jgi:hypothetical protein